MAVFRKSFGPFLSRFPFFAPPAASLPHGVALCSLLPAAALGTVLAVSGLCWRSWKTMTASGLWRYADSGLPMLISPDSFRHLASARAMLEDGLRLEADTAPGALLALLCSLTRISPEALAFALTVPLLLLPGLSTVPWSGLLRLSPAAAAAAAFCLSLFPALTARVSLGVYDADPVTLALWNLLLYGTTRLSLFPPSGAGGRAASGLAWGLCAAVLYWFCSSNLWLCGICLFLWAFFSGGRCFSARGARLALLCGLAVPVVRALLPIGDPLPSEAVSARDSILSALGCLPGFTREVFHLSVADLAPLSLSDWLSGIGGSVPAGMGCLACTALLFAARPELVPFLAPCAFLLGLGAVAQRFLHLGALAVALGIAFLPTALSLTAGRLSKQPDGTPVTAQKTEQAETGEKKPEPQKRSRFSAVRLAGLGLTLWLLWSLADAQHRRIKPPEGHTTAEDRVLIALRDLAGPETRAFNWWDDGSVIRARTGIEPFSDSCTRAPLSAFIASRGLSLANPLQARLWIRFFARRGPTALEPFYALWGGRDAAFARLEQIFAADDPRKVAARFPFPRMYGPEWLFPGGKVVLYLPERFLLLNPWWMALSRSPQTEPQTVTLHLERFARTEFDYDAEAGELALPSLILERGYRSVGRVFLTHVAPLHAPFGADAPEPLLVTSFYSPWIYLVDAAIMRTLAFRLLAPSGEILRGFRPIAADPAAAGAWEVLP